MRNSGIIVSSVAVLTACTSGCYVDGRMQAPTWETMTAVWRRPKPNQEGTALANAPPNVTMPSSTIPPGRGANGGVAVSHGTPMNSSLATGNPLANSAPAGFAATNASFNQPPATGGRYPDTGKQAIGTYASGGNPASPASYNTSGGGSWSNPNAGYPSGGRYDAPTSNPYAQSGPYDGGAGRGDRRSAAAESYERSPASQGPGNTYARGGQADPYGDDYADARIADRRAATGGQDAPRGADYVADRNVARDAASADPRTARRDGPIIPGNTGYATPQASDYARPVTTDQPSSSNPGAGQGFSSAGNAAPRRESNWSPGGTSRYQPPAANDGTTVNPYARESAAPRNDGASYAAPANGPATREPAPVREANRASSGYSDPYAPEIPVSRPSDASRYDGIE